MNDIKDDKVVVDSDIPEGHVNCQNVMAEIVNAVYVQPNAHIDCPENSGAWPAENPLELTLGGTDGTYIDICRGKHRADCGKQMTGGLLRGELFTLFAQTAADKSHFPLERFREDYRLDNIFDTEGEIRTPRVVLGAGLPHAGKAMLYNHPSVLSQVTPVHMESMLDGYPIEDAITKLQATLGKTGFRDNVDWLAKIGVIGSGPRRASMVDIESCGIVHVPSPGNYSVNYQAQGGDSRWVEKSDGYQVVNHTKNPNKRKKAKLAKLARRKARK